nr:molybdopterin molybdotransferase MoeA [Kribbella solani]
MLSQGDRVDGPQDTPHSNPGLSHSGHVSWDAARELAHAAGRPGVAVSLDLSETIGCVLAVPLISPVAVPPVDRSAMDGYAVCGPGPWQVTHHVAAGATDPGELTEGQATTIVTGATVPTGTTAVIPSEQALHTGNHLTRTSPPSERMGEEGGPARGTGGVTAGAAPPRAPVRDHIRRVGEECWAGDELLSAGVVVGPAVVGLAATVGLDRLTVIPKPTVAALITGDELVHQGPSGPGQVRDAIGPMLPALITQAGAHLPAGINHLGDSLDELTRGLRESQADLTLVSGSSAAGPADHLRQALTALGAELVVDGVACRPGHPQALAQLPDGRLILGLPGNPFAALVAFLTLGVAAIARMRGLPLAELPQIAIPGGVHCHPTSTRLVPVRLTPDGAVPIGHDGSAMLRGPATADALAVVTPGPTKAIAARLLTSAGTTPWAG